MTGSSTRPVRVSAKKQAEVTVPVDLYQHLHRTSTGESSKVSFEKMSWTGRYVLRVSL